ncbi:MAG: hypothetical protein AAF411_27590, partial [Myxococcota bacterium]
MVDAATGNEHALRLSLPVDGKMLHFHSIVDERPTCRVLCFALTFIGFVACGGAAYRLDDAPRVTTAVSIDAPAGCALQARLREALGDHMGSVSFDVRAEGQVQMRVQLSQSSEGWAASIRTTSASGELLGIRELTLPADSCEDAGEALAFVAELVVDTPAVAAAVEAAEEAPARPGPRVYLGAAASGALGRSPSPSASLGVFTSASWRAFELRFGAFGLLPGSEGGLRRVRIGGAELRGEACPAFSVGTGRFAFCGGLAGGLLRAEGSGFVQD